ncbi:hypothetical protein AOL_s00210g117 [Orbilia oligospora ATCC 24927]|uniref:Mid2 domain-containing protein n=2 Tax=Orbilia oligospora TaxID=2813651 RepID=G1XRV9_ARTOA|nr:hypothetical protein AOL_s00210g117 [Orbilia oligospora ATCC 24927]EGX44136.1 hypothetical protein AOL_s00210g117 [Orbilia oligospora ATCC 24927]KAF3289970.1 hypothetical protein TWF970_003712 [Orbilia oligospora]
MALAVHITAAPVYQPPQIIGRGGPLDILDKRQQLTFSTCGLQCAAADFCQAYRSNFGFCCPTSVLTRTAFNYCGPATTCIPYGVSSVSDFFFDSTSSIQYCGVARPSCVTYVYRNDDFTQVFCASGESGTSFFETTSTRQQSATFIGRTTSSEETTTTSESTSEPTATVASNTSTNGSNPTSDSSDTPTSSGDSNSGLSTGAVAGIGVGAALAGIGAAIGAFFLWRRSNNKKKLAAAGASGGQNFPPQPPMANTQGYNNNNTGYYQQQQPYAQVPQGHQAELAGGGAFGGQEYYKGAYPPPVSPGGVPPPQTHPNVYELGGGGQAPVGGNQGVYQENTAPQFRQELQG